MSSLLNKQSKRRSLDVAVKHYNIGNELFKYMLGDTMTYTCGYWKTATTLEQAQIDKFELIAKKIGIKANQHILELGCGWGAFAKYIAEKYGCRVTAVNISEAQIEYAQQQAQNLPINYMLCDYRDQAIYNPNKIKFDAVVSVGLCEHVGYKNYKHLAQIALGNMVDDGLFLLHTIGNNVSTRHVDPWFNKYIFPHGVIPSITQLSSAFEKTFVIEDLHNFGAYYDNTLMAWHKNFNDSWEHIKHDYDERFRRMWNYYLLASAAGFRTRSIQLWQFVLSPHGIRGVYHRTS